MTTVTPQGSEMMINYLTFSDMLGECFYLFELTGGMAIGNKELRCICTNWSVSGYLKTSVLS